MSEKDISSKVMQLPCGPSSFRGYNSDITHSCEVFEEDWKEMFIGMLCSFDCQKYTVISLTAISERYPLYLIGTAKSLDLVQGRTSYIIMLRENNEY
jgi:hypothetical protein